MQIAFKIPIQRKNEVQFPYPADLDQVILVATQMCPVFQATDSASYT